MTRKIRLVLFASAAAVVTLMSACGRGESSGVSENMPSANAPAASAPHPAMPPLDADLNDPKSLEKALDQNPNHTPIRMRLAELALNSGDAAKAAELAARLGPERAGVVTDLGAAAARADGIVNTTPVGMAKLPGLPLPAELIAPHHWVADIVYFPLETELLATARARGCRLLPGSGMALFQAVRAFELFTGRTPNPQRMWAAFDRPGPLSAAPIALSPSMSCTSTGCAATDTTGTSGCALVNRRVMASSRSARAMTQA